MPVLMFSKDGHYVGVKLEAVRIHVLHGRERVPSKGILFVWKLLLTMSKLLPLSFGPEALGSR